MQSAVIPLLLIVITLSLFSMNQSADISNIIINSALAQVSNSVNQTGTSGSLSPPSIQTAQEEILIGIQAISVGDTENALLHLNLAHEQLSILSGTIPNVTSSVQSTAGNETLPVPSSLEDSTADATDSTLTGPSE